ncbi:MAG: type II secretion system ATPase GspE [Nitrospinae bacterium]|nr:type II secretion system ATPase GspE [Nitrospinota bacterium]
MSGAGAIEKELIDAGKLTPEAFRTVKAQNPAGRKSVWKTAVAMGYVAEAEVLGIISRKFDLPFLRADEMPASTFDLVSAGVSAAYLSENKIYPVRLDGDCLEAVVCDPAAIPMVEALLVGTDRYAKVFLATEEAVHLAIERAFGTGASVMESIVDRAGESGVADPDAGGEEDPDHLSDLASGAPVIRLVNLLIQRAVETGASDIHIEPFEDDLSVRYRIDGILHHVEAPPKKMQAAVSSRIKIMARLNIAEKRLPQDGRIRTRVGGKDIDMRVSTIPTVYGESIVMRILDRGSVVIDLNTLGFPKGEREKFGAMIARPYGMLLVTGPTGSGKTTTLYAALDKINTPDKKIITVEDPVEYQMKGINQIQVRPQIGLTFQNGLRSIVRQDPDIIMVGEIRDFETAEIAIQAALTGHMVFSTVHTNDSAGAITRLLDMGIEHYLISSALVGALAQRLVRILCPKCKKPYLPTAEEAREAGSGTLYRETGCKECANTGYRGRLGIYELLAVEDAVRNLILQKASAHVIKEQARRDGMTTLREDGFAKVRAGTTSVSEVVRVTAEEVL